MEELKHCPRGMYMLAVRTGRRLPDELHRSMILWGYDGDKDSFAKKYFNWLRMMEIEKGYMDWLEGRNA